MEQIKTEKIKREKNETHKLETFLDLFNPDLSSLGKPDRIDGTFETDENGELKIGIAKRLVVARRSVYHCTNLCSIFFVTVPVLEKIVNHAALSEFVFQ